MRPFQPRHRVQLHGFNTAGVLDHMQQHPDLPARPVPVDELGGSAEINAFAIPQQPPLQRLHAGRRVHLAHPRKRYTTCVSALPQDAPGILAIGCRANCSAILASRRFSSLSPSSKSTNVGCPVQIGSRISNQ
jgi:hypothetical protein